MKGIRWIKVPLARSLLALPTILALLAVAVLAALSGAAAPPAPDQAPPLFRFAIDTPAYHAGGDAIAIIRNATLAENEPLTIQGWVATNAGISGYQYRWHSSSGAAVDVWQPVEDASIGARGDLTNAQIPYPSGHKTAGFSLTIPPPPDIEAGYYNVYLRAIDGNGAPCDILALYRLCYGNADRDSGEGYAINLDRLVAEGADSLRGGATVSSEGITIPAGGSVRLGELALSGFEQLLITYTTENAADADGRRAVLGLKSTGTHSFGTPGEKYDLTGSLCYAGLSDKPGTLLVDLSTCDYAGETWLTAYTDTPLTITAVELVYNGFGTDRVAAKLYLSADLIQNYFAGLNCMSLSGITDPTLGDVLRMEVTDDTNDPYGYFYAENLLGEADIRLDAGIYRYMVVLARAKPENAGDHAAFYLCAGHITGPSGSLTSSFLTENDGRWHYYLLDLGENPLWDGIIHGWRFDIINGNCKAGDTVDFASIQLFRTREAAEAVAARSPSDAPAFTRGAPAVEKDLCEEAASGPYVIDPTDAFVAETETTPALETAPGETDTLPAGTAPPADSLVPAGTETDPTPETTSTEALPDAGCASRVSLALLILLSVAALPLLRRRRRHA